MKVTLTKKQVKIIAACLEELESSQYWRTEWASSGHSALTFEGHKAIGEINEILSNKYDIDSGDMFEFIFQDMAMQAVDK